jgi:hypothetical protein
MIIKNAGDGKSIDNRVQRIDNRVQRIDNREQKLARPINVL